MLISACHYGERVLYENKDKPVNVTTTDHEYTISDYGERLLYENEDCYVEKRIVYTGRINIEDLRKEKT